MPATIGPSVAGFTSVRVWAKRHRPADPRIGLTVRMPDIVASRLNWTGLTIAGITSTGCRLTVVGSPRPPIGPSSNRAWKIRQKIRSPRLGGALLWAVKPLPRSCPSWLRKVMRTGSALANHSARNACERIIKAVAKHHRINPREYQGAGNHVAGRDLAAFLCRKWTPVTLSGLSEQLGLGPLDGSASLVRRAAQRINHSASARRTMEEIEKQLGLNS